MHRLGVSLTVALCASAFARTAGAGDVDPRSLVREVLTVNVHGADRHRMEVELPDLEATDIEIVPDNVRALAVVYFASQLEEMKVFAAADRVSDAFASGRLPITRGADASSAARPAPRRGSLPEPERRALYASTIGANNREFDALMARWIGAVATFDRVPPAPGSPEPTRASIEQVRRASKDLAENLSLHGYGAALHAAELLRAQISDALGLLSRPDVMSAFDAADEWAVIERVSAESLGGAPNSVKHRTLGTTGAHLLSLLADWSALTDSGLQAVLAGQPTIASLARAWASVADPVRSTSANVSKAELRRPRREDLALLCFDESGRLQRCKVTVKKRP